MATKKKKSTKKLSFRKTSPLKMLLAVMVVSAVAGIGTYLLTRSNAATIGGPIPIPRALTIYRPSTGQIFNSNDGGNYLTGGLGADGMPNYFNATVSTTYTIPKSSNQIVVCPKKVLGGANKQGWDVDYDVWTFYSGKWTLRPSSAGSLSGWEVFYGNPGDTPLCGDWDNSGSSQFGVYRPSNQTFYLSVGTSGTKTYKFGNLGDKPLVGDWNGDGKVSIGVYRPNNATFYLTNLTNNAIGTVTTKSFGNIGDTPIVTKIPGGTDTNYVGVKRGNSYYNANGSVRVIFGEPTDVPIGPVQATGANGIWGVNW